MSRGDIPIIVDACISFVTQHGAWVLADSEPVEAGERGPMTLASCSAFLSLTFLIFKMGLLTVSFPRTVARVG